MVRRLRGATGDDGAVPSTAAGPAVELDPAAGLARDERRRRGAWATPPWLVDHVLAVVLEPVLAGRARIDRLTVLDPACGDGRFLAAAAARIERRFRVSSQEAAGCVVGIELDPATAALARRRLGPRATVVVGDTLQQATVRTPVDVVVGNPPYLSQLAAATSRRGRSPHGGGPYADAAAEFLAVAVSLARPDGGRVGLVLPQSILATRDAAPIRATVLSRARLDGVWWAGEPVFDAAVHTIVATFVRGEAQREVRRWWGSGLEPLPPAAGGDLASRPTWSHLLADAAGIPIVAPATNGVVGDHATATAGFRDQFYGLRPHVTDGPTEAPLVTAGLIEPGRCAWGERPARFAGRQLLRPGVDLASLGRGDPKLARWVAARRVPKVLLATQTAVLEAAPDPAGTWVPSVPVISVEPRPGSRTDVWTVAAVLGSPVASAWAASTYLGAGLGSTAIKLAASQVLTLPWPPGSLEDAAARLEDGDVDGAARGVARRLRPRSRRRGAGLALVGGAPAGRQRSSAARRSGDSALTAPGAVSTSTPSSVTRIVCSNCAVRRPSAVTAVQPSSHMTWRHEPIVIIGSIVNVMPGPHDRRWRSGRSSGGSGGRCGTARRCRGR